MSYIYRFTGRLAFIFKERFKRYFYVVVHVLKATRGSLICIRYRHKLKARRCSLTHYLPVSSYDDRGSKFKFYIKKGSMKKFPERRDYAAVAGKQQFSIARTKLPPLVIAGGNELICIRYLHKLVVFNITCTLPLASE